MDNRVVASWSGGIDSTAVIANLLDRGYEVHAFSLTFEGGEFGAKFHEREATARENLLPILADLAKEGGGKLYHRTKPASWLWAFSPDKRYIPRRNKHIIDHLVTTEAMPRGIFNVAMGEYVGADTWIVKDHVGATDADHRALSAYIWAEYGIKYRLFSLQDFGESRYKSHRLLIGWEVLGEDMALTTNCLADSLEHCGTCYKCIERHAAFETLGLRDKTQYATDPGNNPHFAKYMAQMRGERVTLPFTAFQ